MDGFSVESIKGVNPGGAISRRGTGILLAMAILLCPRTEGDFAVGGSLASLRDDRAF